MIGSAQTLVNRFQSMSQNLNQIRDGLNGQISNSVTSDQQLCEANRLIERPDCSGAGQYRRISRLMRLLDQRDQLVNQLSQEIRVSTIKQSDGAMNVFIGNGQSLVLGNQTTTLQAVASTTDPTALEVAYSTNGTVNSHPAELVAGRQSGGYIEFPPDRPRSGNQCAWTHCDGFCRYASISSSNKGIDLNGALGTNMFTPAVPRVTAATSNTGNGVLTATINSTSALTGHDYSVQFDGTNYNVYDTSTNSLVQSITPAQMAAGGQAVTGTGITLQLDAGHRGELRAIPSSFVPRWMVRAASHSTSPIRPRSRRHLPSSPMRRLPTWDRHHCGGHRDGRFAAEREFAATGYDELQQSATHFQRDRSPGTAQSAHRERYTYTARSDD